MIKWGIIGPGAIANAFAKEVNNSQGEKLLLYFEEMKKELKASQKNII